MCNNMYNVPLERLERLERLEMLAKYEILIYSREPQIVIGNGGGEEGMGEVLLEVGGIVLEIGM